MLVVAPLSDPREVEPLCEAGADELYCGVMTEAWRRAYTPMQSPNRRDVVRAIEALHVFLAVTGVEGVVARGIRRLVPEDQADPPFPGDVPATVPLFDEHGDPLPDPKDNGTWREDNSGGVLPPGEWMWKDSCSKDQLDGYVFALGAFYDVIKGDSTIPASKLTRLQADARAIGKRLMEKVHVGYTKKLDLVIQDADGIDPQELLALVDPGSVDRFLRRRLEAKGETGAYPNEALREFVQDPRMPTPTDEELRLLMSVNLEYKEPSKWFYKSLLDTYRNDALFSRVGKAKAPVLR